MTVPVTFSFIITNPGTSVYGVRLNRVNWSSDEKGRTWTDLTGPSWATANASASSTVPTPTVTTDLVLKNVTKASFHPYGFSVNFCVNGSKSINDLKKDNPSITSFPIEIVTSDLNGNQYKTDASAVGGIEDLKNGQCSGDNSASNPGIGITLQSNQYSAYNQTKKAAFTLDPNNLIRETDENNNSYTLVESATASTSPSVSACPGNAGATSQRGQNGSSFTCSCSLASALAGRGYLWGTNTYTDDSNVCAAAKHAGLAIPGNVTYTIRPGQSSYAGSAQNDITSLGYASWPGSFSFTNILAPAVQPSITVLSPNGHETYKVGDTVTLRWSAANVPANTSVMFRLSYFTTGATSRMEDGMSTYYPSAADGSFQWTIPAKYGSGYEPGGFRVRAILFGPNIPGANPPQDISDNSFAITAPQAVNNPPTALITGSTNLTVGETGTWNFSAADRDGNLSQWQFCASTNSSCRWTPVSGSSVSGTYSTSFSSAGTYTWIVNVNDSNGASDKASIDVTVTAPQTPIVSPLSAYCTNTPSYSSSIPSMLWSSSVSGGKSPYQYSWSVYNDVASYGGGSTQSASLTANYSSIGTKQALLNVTDSSGNKTWVSCSGTITAPQTIYTPTQVDLKANGQDSLTVPYLTPITLAWTSSGSLAGACSRTSPSGWVSGGIDSYGSSPSNALAVGTYTFTVNCLGVLNNASDSVAVTVTAPTAPAATGPVINSFSVTPASVTRGENVTFSGTATAQTGYCITKHRAIVVGSQTPSWRLADERWTDVGCVQSVTLPSSPVSTAVNPYAFYEGKTSYEVIWQVQDSSSQPPASKTQTVTVTAPTSMIGSPYSAAIWDAIKEWYAAYPQ